MRSLAAAAALVLAPLAAAGAGGPIHGTVTASPLAISLSLSDASVRVDKHVKATAAVADLGSAPIANVGVTLRVDPTGVLVVGGPDRTIDKLRPGHPERVKWKLCARRAGSWVLIAKAVAGSFSAESDAQVLTIAPNPKAKQVCVNVEIEGD